MSTSYKFNYRKQKLTDFATKSESIFQLCSVASLFVPQNKYFASKLKSGEFRCAQEGEEGGFLLLGGQGR